MSVTPASPALHPRKKTGSNKNHMVKRVLFFLLLFASAFLHAQTVPSPPSGTPSSSYYSEGENDDEWHFVLYAQYSHLFYKTTPGLLEVKFPYRITSQLGTMVTDTFAGSTHGTKRSMGNFFALPGVEMSHKNLVIDINISPFQLPRLGWRYNAYAGAGYRFRYDKFFDQFTDLRPVLENFPLTFKFGLQLHNAMWNMGRVNMNYMDSFTAFGNKLEQTEDEPEEQESCHVDVVYLQKMIAFVPGLSFGFRPVDNNFDAAISLSYYFPVTLENGFAFVFNDSDQDDPHYAPGYFGMISSNQPGLHASYNHGHVPDSPYSMKGWMLSARVGFYFGD